MQLRTSVLLLQLTFFTFSAIGQICTANFGFEDEGVNVQFTDLSTSAAGDPIISWFWDFEDGTSTQQNPFHTFEDTDEFDVCLTITTQSGCTNTFCIELQICSLIMTTNVDPNCNENGEIEVNLVISDPLDEAIEVDVLLDGTPVGGGPWDIDDDAPVSVTVFVPGDGLSHTITAQSTEVGHCNATFEITTQDCNSNCFLSGMQTSITNTNEHTVQVGGNFFSPQSINVLAGDVIHFTWIDDGHSTTSDATSGPDAWNSGVQGSGYLYDVQITNPGTHPYYCIPHGGPGGSGMSGVIIANCPPGGQFDILVSFQTTIADPQGYNVLVDGNVQPGSPFSYSGTGQNMVQFTLPGDGQTHEIQIADVADPSCFLSNTFVAPDCGAAPACSIALTAEQAGPCQAGGTLDYTLTLQTINTGTSGFFVEIDGNPAGGPFPYAPAGPTTITIEVPGDGQVHQITAIDAEDATCSGMVSVTTIDCSIPCTLGNLTASTGSANIHTVEVQDFQFDPSEIQITSGDIVEFQWVGEVDHTSTSDATSGPNSWDSGLLGNGATFQTPALTEGVHPYYCIPHGAPGGVGMSGSITVQADCTNDLVSVSISFEEEGGGFGGYQVYLDGNLIPGGPFSYDPSGQNNLVIQAPGDGQNHTIEVRDSDDATCSAITSITTPNCQVSTCQLQITAGITGDCNKDLEVPVSLTIQDINGSVAGFSVFIDDQPLSGSPFPYHASGTTVIEVTLPGDGQNHTFRAEDVEDQECFATTEIGVPDCSIPCEITELVVLEADATKHIVEVRDFDFSPEEITIAVGDTVEWVWMGEVAHTSTSDAITGADSWDSGLLENGDRFIHVFQSAGIHPYYCIPHGAPGGIGMSGIVTAVENCDNAMVPVNLQFQISGGSQAGFYLTLDGDTIAGPLPYSAGAVQQVQFQGPGDGMTHVIGLIDANDSACEAFLEHDFPECTPHECSILLNANPGSCNEEGNYTFTLDINHSNTGDSGFNVFIDGIAHSGNPFPYDDDGTTSQTLILPGTGAVSQIVIQDQSMPGCADTIDIQTTNCTAGCAFDAFSWRSLDARLHVVEVRDFDFFPKDLAITLGDTVRFIWTGEVPHTSTSDATSGPDAWDSGLLNSGATYEVIIETEGLHRYYCIPHGGPGGIGMAGTITANPYCDNGFFPAEICFQVENPGNAGIDLYIDNELINQTPIILEGTEIECIQTLLPGDGESHSFSLRDVEKPDCRLDTLLLLPDCKDPCFNFSGNFIVDVDHQSLMAGFEAGLPSDAMVDSWDFGDGTTSSEPEPAHQYDTAGFYQVCLMISNSLGCTDTICRNIFIGTFLCEPLFDYDTDGLLVQFTDISSVSLTPGKWTWSFGDGSQVVGVQHPLHQYHELGVYEVCMSIEVDTCFATYCRTLDLSSPCFLAQASFDIQDEGNGSFNFINTSNGTFTSFLWGFGDGNLSTEEHAAYQYQSGGSFTVCLLAIDDENSCSVFHCEDIQVVFTGVDRPDIRIHQLLSYPNPLTGERTEVSLIGWKESDIGQSGMFRLIDMHGIAVKEWNNLRIRREMHLKSNEPIPSGAYLLHITTSERIYVGKLVVQ